MIKTTLGIEGMMCGMCESHINNAIRNNFKVKKVIYDFKKKKIGDLVFKNLALDKYYTNSNDRSSIIYVTINYLNYLFTGDISKEVESDLYQTYHHLDVDVLKVAHHGSKNSTTKSFLEEFQPQKAIISAGMAKNIIRENDYEKDTYCSYSYNYFFYGSGIIYLREI